MIKFVKHGNIFDAAEHHITFAINQEGFNRYGFPKQVIESGWLELARITTYPPLGSILTKEMNGKYFHALVCYSLKYGWKNIDTILQQCFNQIDCNPLEPIATVNIGHGDRGGELQADTEKIKTAMHSTQKILTLYHY